MQGGSAQDGRAHFDGDGELGVLALGLGEFVSRVDMSLSTLALVPVAYIQRLGTSFHGRSFWQSDPLSHWPGAHSVDSLLLHHEEPPLLLPFCPLAIVLDELEVW